MQLFTDCIENKGLMVANTLNTAEIYEGQNKPAEALRKYRIAQRLRDSMNLHNQEIRIAALTQNQEVNDIIYCVSQSNYSTFHLSAGHKILISKTIKDVEKLLSPFFFIRVHRSFLINPNYMKKYFHGEDGFILMQDETNVPVSNQHKKQSKGFLMPWEEIVSRKEPKK